MIGSRTLNKSWFRRHFVKTEQPPTVPEVHLWYDSNVTRAFFHDTVDSREKWLLLKMKLQAAANTGEIPGMQLPTAGQRPYTHVRVYRNYLALDRLPVNNGAAQATLVAILAETFGWQQEPQVNNLSSMVDYRAFITDREMHEATHPRAPRLKWHLGRFERHLGRIEGP